MSEKYQVMPPLSGEEYEALKASIAKAGRIYSPIIMDGEHNIIDGHNRARACEELGIDYRSRYGETHIRDIDELEARMLARRLNLGRRHLTREQLAQIVLDVKAEHPRWSARKISAELGGMPSEFTVREILGCATARSSQLRTSPKVESQDGRSRPASAEAAAEQRAKIASAIGIHPNRSNRDIAAELGCSDRTVGKVRADRMTQIRAATPESKTAAGPPHKSAPTPTAAPPDPGDVRDARAFADELEAVLKRALGRRPEMFMDLLTPKRQDQLAATLGDFTVWADRAIRRDA